MQPSSLALSIFLYLLLALSLYSIRIPTLDNWWVNGCDTIARSTNVYHPNGRRHRRRCVRGPHARTRLPSAPVSGYCGELVLQTLEPRSVPISGPDYITYANTRTHANLAGNVPLTKPLENCSVSV